MNRTTTFLKVWISLLWKVTGQVPNEIYFVDRDYWFYNIIQSYLLSRRTARRGKLAFAFHDRDGIRLSWVALAVLLGIALTNNFLLLSLIGLAIIGLHQLKNISSLATESA